MQAAISEKPDLILLDINMPVQDGISMMQELQNDSWGASVPVIILTNVKELESIVHATFPKIKDYLVKSDWKIQEVVDLVKERLGLKK